MFTKQPSILEAIMAARAAENNAKREEKIKDAKDDIAAAIASLNNPQENTGFNQKYRKIPGTTLAVMCVEERETQEHVLNKGYEDESVSKQFSIAFTTDKPMLAVVTGKKQQDPKDSEEVSYKQFELTSPANDHYSDNTEDKIEGELNKAISELVAVSNFKQDLLKANLKDTKILKRIILKLDMADDKDLKKATPAQLRIGQIKLARLQEICKTAEDSGQSTQTPLTNNPNPAIQELATTFLPANEAGPTNRQYIDLLLCLAEMKRVVTKHKQNKSKKKNSPARNQWYLVDQKDSFSGGSYGEVYKAYNVNNQGTLDSTSGDDKYPAVIVVKMTVLEREETISNEKVVGPTKTNWRSAENEAEIHGRLNRAYKTIPINTEKCFIPQEYIDGKLLETWVEQNRDDITYEKRTNIAIQIIAQVSSLHNNKTPEGGGSPVLHLDIQPKNIIITDHPDHKVKAVLLDHGESVKQEDSSKDSVSEFSTGYFKAPEISNVSSLYSIKTDIYALGCTLEKLFCFQMCNFVPGSDLEHMRKFIEKMEDEDPHKRPDIDQCLKFFNVLSIMKIASRVSQAGTSMDAGSLKSLIEEKGKELKGFLEAENQKTPAPMPMPDIFASPNAKDPIGGSIKTESESPKSSR